MNTSPQGWDLSATLPRFLAPLLTFSIHRVSHRPAPTCLCPLERVSRGLLPG